jgi:ADP-ribosylglycohydrolase/catechol 2,3-dioxygenase-like lactoylglutathione lyase family enzyme
MTTREIEKDGSPKIQRASGMLLAAATGDALGWPQEYNAHRIDRRKSDGTLTASPIFQKWVRRAGGRFFGHYETILSGEYSDDTQLLLCTARSLMRGDSWWQSFTNCEFPTWLLYERGGGRAVKQAAASWLSGRAPWDQESPDDFRNAYFQAGSNGAAMRIAPHVIVGASDTDFSGVLSSVFANSICSHGHPRALIGATLYGFMLWSAMRWNGTLPYGGLIDLALDGEKIWTQLPVQDDKILHWLIAAEHLNKEYRTLWTNVADEALALLKICKDGMKQGALSVDQEILRKIGCFNKTTSGSGTISAVASIFLASRYAADPIHGLLEGAFAPNADTDTLASMTGGLLGAVLGSEWLLQYAEKVQDFEYIRTIGNDLSAKAKSNGPHAGLVKKSLIDEFLSRLTQTKQGDRVVLPDAREALVSASIPLTIGSAPGPGRVWQLKTSDGQTLYVKRLSRQRSGTISADQVIQQQKGIAHNNAKPNSASRHLGLKVPVVNLVKSRAFYSEVLGLSTAYETAFEVAFKEALVLEASNRKKEACVEDVPQPTIRPSIILFVDAPLLDTISERIANTHHPEESHIQTKEGRRSLRCYDPDGNVVEVIEGRWIRRPSPQAVQPPLK